MEYDEYFLVVNMNCFVILLKLKVRETDLTMLFPLCPLVSVPRAPVYVGSVLCGIGGNHSLLWSVFGKVESLGQLRGTKMCCSIEVHHIFSMLQVGICSHSRAVTDIERVGFFFFD